MLLLFLLLAGARCTDVTVKTEVDSEQKISAISGSFDGKLTIGDQFGNAVTDIGDLESDGVTDLAVGVPFDDDNGQNRGAVWILFMDDNGHVDLEQKISDDEGGFEGGLDNDDRFGTAVTAIGDLNEDGILDIAVGSPLDDDKGTDRGALWVLFLNADGTVQQTHKISAKTGDFTGDLDDGDQFGSAVANLGDLDGDEINDLAVGVQLDDDGGSDTGAVWILFMNIDGTVKSSQKISSTKGDFDGGLDNNDHFGSAVAGIGDLDGDGIPDLAVGANQDNDGGLNRGALWILFLNNDGTVRSHQKISHTRGGFEGTLDAGDRFGSSVASIGDLDGNGAGDLAVGADHTDDGGNDRGAVWILFMFSSGKVDSQVKISDTKGGFGGTLNDEDAFGSAVTGVSDLDGDGRDDIAVGAPLDDSGGIDKGATWILFMKRTETETGNDFFRIGGEE